MSPDPGRPGQPGARGQQHDEDHARLVVQEFSCEHQGQTGVLHAQAERERYPRGARQAEQPGLNRREHQTDDAVQDRIRADIRAALVRRTRDEWVDLLADADTCVAPVLDTPEVFAFLDHRPLFPGHTLVVPRDDADYRQ